MPTYLEEFGYFADVISIRAAQEALLGQRTAEDVADEWAKYLTTPRRSGWQRTEPSSTPAGPSRGRRAAARAVAWLEPWTLRRARRSS